MLGAKLTESTEVVVPHFTRRCSWTLPLADCFVQKQVCFLRDCISNATRKLSCDPSNFPMNPSPVERPTKRICNPPIPGHHHSNRWHSVLLYHIDRQSNRAYRMATRSYKSKQHFFLINQNQTSIRLKWNHPIKFLIRALGEKSFAFPPKLFSFGFLHSSAWRASHFKTLSKTIFYYIIISFRN